MKSIFKIITPIFVVALLAVGSFSAAYALYDVGFNSGLGETEIVGTVDEVTDTGFTVGGVTYLVTTATEIEGLIEQGVLVKVHLSTDADGNQIIREIELVDAVDLSDDDDMDDDIYDDMSDDDDDMDDSDSDDDSYGDGDDDDSNSDDDDSNHDDSDDDDSDDDDSDDDDHSNDYDDDSDEDDDDDDDDDGDDD